MVLADQQTSEIFRAIIHQQQSKQNSDMKLAGLCSMTDRYCLITHTPKHASITSPSPASGNLPDLLNLLQLAPTPTPNKPHTWILCLQLQSYVTGERAGLTSTAVTPLHEGEFLYPGFIYSQVKGCQNLKTKNCFVHIIETTARRVSAANELKDVTLSCSSILWYFCFYINKISHSLLTFFLNVKPTFWTDHQRADAGLRQVPAGVYTCR